MECWGGGAGGNSFISFAGCNDKNEINEIDTVFAGAYVWQKYSRELAVLNNLLPDFRKKVQLVA